MARPCNASRATGTGSWRLAHDCPTREIAAGCRSKHWGSHVGEIAAGRVRSGQEGIAGRGDVSAGGYHALHIIRYDARIKSARPHTLRLKHFETNTCDLLARRKPSRCRPRCCHSEPTAGGYRRIKRLGLDRLGDVVQYLDTGGNSCCRVIAPAGRILLSADFIIRDNGLTDDCEPDAPKTRSKKICPPRRSSSSWAGVLRNRPARRNRLVVVWTLFLAGPGGGHCRLCPHPQQVQLSGLSACLPRQTTSYLGDIGVPVASVMDFSAWFDVYLGDRWYAFDARNNQRRIGRILMARGRDATDVAIANTFGPATLSQFTIITEEVF